MRISDEPDEDANDLDDDVLFEAYLDAETPPAVGGPPARDEAMPEWPPVRVRTVGLSVDTSTLAWFKGNHLDWRREMALILRSWVAVQTAPQSDGK